jgi:MerR family transcriptional regulator, repressor of the yfmOP operon
MRRREEKDYRRDKPSPRQDDLFNAIALNSSIFNGIKEVAARTGFTKRTLRYYEEIGLITPAGRSEGNYRLYSEADVARLQRIKRLKDVLGIPLSSIKRLAEVEETLDALGTELGSLFDPPQRRTRLLQAHAELEQQPRTIDARLATLTHVRAEYAHRLARIDQVLGV